MRILNHSVALSVDELLSGRNGKPEPAELGLTLCGVRRPINSRAKTGCTQCVEHAERNVGIDTGMGTIVIDGTIGTDDVKATPQHGAAYMPYNGRKNCVDRETE